MISWYHECVFRQRSYDRSIGEFIRDPYLGIKNYIEHVEFYFNAYQRVNHMTITYENLQSDTSGILKEVLEFLGLNLPVGAINEIVNNSTFAKMQAIERENRYNVYYLKSNPSDPRTWKLRTGGKDKLEEYFSPSDLQYIRSRYEDSQPFVKLGYVV